MRVTVTPEHLRGAFPAAEGEGAASAKPQSELYQALSLCRGLIPAMGALSEAIYPGGLIERMLKERVILDISRANACRYCIGSHTATMRSLGIDDPIASLDDPAGLTDRERIALEYARATMRDANRVPDELFVRLKSAFSDPEIVELTFLIGFMQTLNLFNSALQVTYYEDPTPE